MVVAVVAELVVVVRLVAEFDLMVVLVVRLVAEFDLMVVLVVDLLLQDMIVVAELVVVVHLVAEFDLSGSHLLLISWLLNCRRHIFKSWHVCSRGVWTILRQWT